MVLAPIQVQADWLSEIRLGSELGGSASLQWLLEKQSDPITQRLSLDYLNQSANDRYQLGYRAQFNISRSFYHFAKLTTGANHAIGVENSQSVVMASANSPYRGPSGGLALEIGAGFQRLEFADSLSADSRNEVQPVLMFRGRVSRSLGDRFSANLDLLAFSGNHSTDLTTTLSAIWQLHANTTLHLSYQLWHIYPYRTADIQDKTLTLSISYRIDWLPASKRWPDT